MNGCKHVHNCRASKTYRPHQYACYKPECMKLDWGVCEICNTIASRVSKKMRPNRRPYQDTASSPESRAADVLGSGRGSTR